MALEKGSYHFNIEQRDVDFNDKSTYSSMIYYILETAAADADKNHFGVKDLNRDNCTWVVTRVSVEFDQRLDKGEQLNIDTWVSDVRRMMTVRHMVATDSRGERVARATTQWAVIDLESRKAIDVSKYCEVYEVSEEDSKNIIDIPLRVRPINSPAKSSEHTVNYSDLDFNKHMNTMRYIDLMMDMLPMDILYKGRLARMDMNFVLEARYGDKLTVNMEQLDDKKTAFEIKNQNDDPICRVVLRWC